MHKKNVVLAVVLLTLLGCKGADDASQSAAIKNDASQALTKTEDGQHFYNARFDFSVEKPTDWYAQNVEELMQLGQKGVQALSGDDENMKAALDASLKSSLTLFSFFEFPPGTPGKLNSNVAAVAENVAAYPGIKNGCDYIANMRQVVAQSQMNMTFKGECQVEQLAKSNFGYLDATTKVGNIVVNQRYWACRKEDHAISIVQTYYNEQQKAATTAIVESIKIQCNH